jgi:glyoxylase-like metal-dependent hydrolase (beta-lactamase superfamily II)/ADP-ribose pyrophosphatase YjhB (NUDIX family)
MSPKDPPSTIRPAAAIILHRGHNLWLGHRGQTRFLPGFSVFPGGGCETGESFVQAARRELMEETGIVLNSVAELKPFARAITPAYSRFRYDVRVYSYELPMDCEPIPDGLEFIDGWWLSAKEILRLRACGELQLAPPTYRQVRLWHDCLNRRQAWPSELSAFEQPPPRNEQVLPMSEGLTIVPLRTRSLPPAAWTNTAIIGERRLLVVDPGGKEQAALQTEIQRRTSQGAEILGVFLSHHHRDHTEGFHQLGLSHLPLYCHRITAAKLPTDFPPATLLSDQEEVPIESGLTVVAHFTPGHAPGHLALELRERRALLAGDMISSLSSIVIPPPEEGSLTEYLASLERLRALDCHLVVPSHGPPYGKGSDPFGQALQHRIKRQEQVVAVLRNGERSVQEIVSIIYRDLDPRLAPAAETNVCHYLRRLQSQGLAAQCDHTWKYLEC